MRFGILGDAKIAREWVAPAILAAGHQITCLGRRDSSSSSPHTLWQGIEQDSYDGLLARDDVDAVYIPLPNHLHVPWAIKALEQGKHVLCEKPLALNRGELTQLEQTARSSGCYLYEGFMVRYHPQWQWLSELDIGTRQLVTAQFSYPPQPQGNIRNFAEMGGGPVWDIGCYCVLAGLMLFDGTPQLAGRISVPESELDVEKSASALLDFGNGQMLSMMVSSGVSLSQSVRVVGSDGWAELDVPFNPPEVTTARWAHKDHGKEGLLSPGQEVRFDACNHYQLMVEDFAEACAQNRAPDFADSFILTDILGQIVLPHS